jgi:hypothetical protein
LERKVKLSEVKCVKFVPHSLTDEQEKHRITIYEDFIQTCQTNPHFLNCTVTGDEYWAFQCDLEIKHRIKEWRMESSSSPKNFSLAKVEDEMDVDPPPFFLIHRVIQK